MRHFIENQNVARDLSNVNQTDNAAPRQDRMAKLATGLVLDSDAAGCSSLIGQIMLRQMWAAGQGSIDISSSARGHFTFWPLDQTFAMSSLQKVSTTFIKLRSGG